MHKFFFLLGFVIAILGMSACFPYNWHEQELRKADDATQACVEELDNVRDNLAICQGKLSIEDARVLERGRAELKLLKSEAK